MKSKFVIAVGMLGTVLKTFPGAFRRDTSPSATGETRVHLSGSREVPALPSGREGTGRHTGSEQGPSWTPSPSAEQPAVLQRAKTRTVWTCSAETLNLVDNRAVSKGLS